MHRTTTFAAALVAALALAAPAVAAAKDVNHDGLPDRWERVNHLSLKVNQAKRDQDHDGLVNRLGFADHTNPRRADSDGDGVKDGQEDSDRDGVVNASDQSPGHDDGSADGGDGREPSTPYVPFDHVVSLSGGVLTIARADGSTVVAALGKETDVECGVQLPGPFHPCGPDRLVAGAKVGAAMHEAQDGTDTWTRVFLVGIGGTPTTTTTTTTTSPALPPAPLPTGSVVSFDAAADVLVVARPSGERPSGPVAPDAAVRCLTISGGVVTSTATCDPATALVPDAVLGNSRRTLVNGVWTWTTLDVLLPAAAPGTPATT